MAFTANTLLNAFQNELIVRFADDIADEESVPVSEVRRDIRRLEGDQVDGIYQEALARADGRDSDTHLNIVREDLRAELRLLKAR